VLGFLWIAENGDRYFREVPQDLWGDERGAIQFWASQCARPWSSPPAWLFVMLDNRQKLFAASDDAG
jgi:hypothetical protein